MESFRQYYEDVATQGRLQALLKQLHAAYEAMDPYHDTRGSGVILGTPDYMPPEQAQSPSDETDSFEHFSRLMANQNRRIREAVTKIAQAFRQVRKSYENLNRASQQIDVIFAEAWYNPFSWGQKPEEPTATATGSRLDKEMHKINRSLSNPASIYLDSLVSMRNSFYAMQKVMNQFGDFSAMRQLYQQAKHDNSKNAAWDLYQALIGFGDTFSRFQSIFETYVPTIYKELTAMLPRLSKRPSVNQTAMAGYKKAQEQPPVMPNKGVARYPMPGASQAQTVVRPAAGV